MADHRMQPGRSGEQSPGFGATPTGTVANEAREASGGQPCTKGDAPPAGSHVPTGQPAATRARAASGADMGPAGAVVPSSFPCTQTPSAAAEALDAARRSQ